MKHAFVFIIVTLILPTTIVATETPEPVGRLAFLLESVNTAQLYERFKTLFKDERTQLVISRTAKVAPELEINEENIALLWFYFSVVERAPNFAELRNFVREALRMASTKAYIYYDIVELEPDAKERPKLRYLVFDVGRKLPQMPGNEEGAPEVYAQQRKYHKLALEIGVFVSTKNDKLREVIISAFESTCDLLEERENSHSYEGATAQYIANLKSPHFQTVAQAIKLLGQLKDPVAVEPLIKLMDEKEEHETRVMQALAAIGDERAIEPLVRKLKDSYWMTRREAAKTLGIMKVKSALPDLHKALNDDNEAVRLEVITAIANIAEPSSVPVLKERYAKAIIGEQMALLIAIGACGQSDAVPFIANELKEFQKKNKNVSQNDPFFKTIVEFHRRAFQALVTTKSVRGVAVMADSLTYPHSLIRATAAQYMGLTKMQEGLKYLETALKSEKEDYVKSTIESAIKNISRAE